MPAPEVIYGNRKRQRFHRRRDYSTLVPTAGDTTVTHPQAPGPAPYDVSASIDQGLKAQQPIQVASAIPASVAPEDQNLWSAAQRVQPTPPQPLGSPGGGGGGGPLPSGGGAVGNRIISWAQKELGKPYVWGAEGPNSFDCSGLLFYCLNKAGITVPRLTADGYRRTYPRFSERSKLVPGDICYFDWGRDGESDHCGFYYGNGKMIAAPHTGAVVSYSDISWSFATFGRIR